MRDNIIVCILALFGILSIPSISLSQDGLEKGITELSQQIASKVSQQHKTTIAVIEFSDLQGSVTDFGRFLAEELITRLYSTEKFKVIERQLLNRVISEQKLNLSGMVDPKSAKELGKLLGVDAIVSGTITDRGNTWRVNARLISTQTGELLAVASTTIRKDDVTKDTTNVKIVLSEKTTENDGFVLELLACYNETMRTVICEVLITNKAENRELSVYASEDRDMSARLYDEFGIEHLAKTVRFGNSESRGEVRQKLVTGSGVKAVFDFDFFTWRRKQIAVLKLGLRTREPWHAKFQNIIIGQ